jgi:tagatose 1,6-diphosphate aldolase
MSMTELLPVISTNPLDPGELRDRDLRLELIEFKPHLVHLVPSYHFRMVDLKTGEESGSINLRLGWDENLLLYAGHMGYGVHGAFQGRRYASRSVVLLKPLARQHGFEELWITCNPDNVASRRSCELAGAEFVETLDLPETSQYYARGMRQKCRYRLSVAE